jgi:2-oxoisovalerate dehydrogenase E1 component
MKEVIGIVREERRPFIIHAKVPLLNHHTSGVRMEWYRDDLEEHASRDPFPLLRKELQSLGIKDSELIKIEKETHALVKKDYKKALEEEDPLPEDLIKHIFAPTTITEEKGEREPKGKKPTVMVDSALFVFLEKQLP